MYINTQTLKTYKFTHEVRADFPEVSLPPALTDEMLASIGVLPVEQTAPAYNPITQSATELPPALVGGKWKQQWEVMDLPQELVDENIAAQAAAEQATINAKVEALWTAADKYTSGYISGVAIGILTIGVLQKKPKAVAVSAWSSSVWAEYYARKALITVTSEDNHDFSSFGPIPYSVPELQKEVGV